MHLIPEDWIHCPIESPSSHAQSLYISVMNLPCTVLGSYFIKVSKALQIISIIISYFWNQFVEPEKLASCTWNKTLISTVKILFFFPQWVNSGQILKLLDPRMVKFNNKGKLRLNLVNDLNFTWPNLVSNSGNISL